MIWDFTDGTDRIDLSGYRNIDSFEDLEMSTIGGTTTINLTPDSGENTVGVIGVDESVLDASDFIFYDEI